MPWSTLTARQRARGGRVVAAALIGVGLVSGCTQGATTTPPTATAPADTADTARALAAAEQLLSMRATAALAHDRSAWDGTLATGSSGVQRLRDEFDVYSAIPWRVLTYDRVVLTDVPTTRAMGAAPTHDLDVTTVTQIRGVESTEHRAKESFTIQLTRDGWRLSGHSSTPDLARPWAAAETRVVSGSSSLVLGTLDQATLERYAADADSAVAKVASLWPGLEMPHPCIVAPATPGEFAVLGAGGASTRTPGQVAAFTDGPIGTDGRATGDRVVLDPDAMTQLTPAGRSFVVTHEAVHVALRSYLPGQATIWLQEGFADWVGYDGTDLDPRQIAGAALDRVRRNGVPTSLPTEESFGQPGTALQVEYQLSWVLVALLVEEHGLAKVRAFVEAATVPGSRADREAAADRAFAAVLGTSRERVLVRWQQRLSELAGSVTGG